MRQCCSFFTPQHYLPLLEVEVRSSWSITPQKFSDSFHLQLVPAKLSEMFGLFILLHFEPFSPKRCRPASAARVLRENEEFLFDQGRVDLVSASSLRITKHLPTWTLQSLGFWNTVVLFSLSCLPFLLSHFSKFQ